MPGFFGKFIRNPWYLGIFISSIFLILFETAIQLKREEAKDSFKLEMMDYGETISNKLTRDLNSIFNVPTEGMVAYLKVYHDNLDSAKLYSYLHELRTHSNAILSLSIAIDSTIRYTEPLIQSQRVINSYLPDNKEQWPDIEKIITTKSEILTGPIKLIQGGSGLILRKPIFFNEHYWGFASTVIRIDSVLELMIKPSIKKNYSLSIKLESDYTVLTNSQLIFGDSMLFENPNAVIIKGAIHNTIWKYAILSTSTPSSLFWINLIEAFGILFILLITITIVAFSQRKRKDAEKIKLSEGRLRAIYDTVLLGVVVLDRKGQHVFANRLAVDIIGIELDEIIGQALHTYVHPDDQDHAYALLEKFNSGALIEHKGELRLVHHISNESIWIHFNASLYPDTLRTGNEEFIIVGFQNITHLKQIEYELIKLNADKNKFFSIIGHDLKSPLNSLSGMLNLLLKVDDAVDKKEYFQKLGKLKEGVETTK